jgi:signal transduction histidine kinase
MQDFVDFIGVLPKFKACKIAVVPGESIPQAALDVDQIQQVLLNLVSNAVQARPDATIVLMSSNDDKTGTVSIAVSDNGPGIEESVLKRLFKEKITTKPDGHGYGLRVCQQILTHHGGSIEVRSQLHEGSTFALTVPALKAS